MKTPVMNITDHVINTVSQETGVTKNLLMSRRRNQFIVDAKQMVVFALHQLGFTQQHIADTLNYSDHTTVNHHLNKKCRQTHENRFRATQVVKSYLDMALYENARLRESLEVKISGEG